MKVIEFSSTSEVDGFEPTHINIKNWRLKPTWLYFKKETYSLWDLNPITLLWKNNVLPIKLNELRCYHLKRLKFLNKTANRYHSHFFFNARLVLKKVILYNSENNFNDKDLSTRSTVDLINQRSACLYCNSTVKRNGTAVTFKTLLAFIFFLVNFKPTIGLIFSKASKKKK